MHVWRRVQSRQCDNVCACSMDRPGTDISMGMAVVLKSLKIV